MKTLYIHSDYMEYEVKKPTPVAEEITESIYLSLLLLLDV